MYSSQQNNQSKPSNWDHYLFSNSFTNKVSQFNLSAWRRCIGSRTANGDQYDIYVAYLSRNVHIPPTYARGNSALHKLLANPVISQALKNAKQHYKCPILPSPEDCHLLPKDTIQHWMILNPSKQVPVIDLENWKNIDVSAGTHLFIKMSHGSLDLLWEVKNNNVLKPGEGLLSFKDLAHHGLVPGRIDYAIAEGALEIPGDFLNDPNSMNNNSQSGHEHIKVLGDTNGELLLKAIWENLRTCLEERGINKAVLNDLERLSKQQLLSYNQTMNLSAVYGLEYYNLVCERGCELLLLTCFNRNTCDDSFLDQWREDAGLEDIPVHTTFRAYGMTTVCEQTERDLKDTFISPSHYYQYSDIYPANVDFQNAHTAFAELHPSNAGNKQQFALNTAKMVQNSQLEHLVLDMTVGSPNDEKLFSLLHQQRDRIAKKALSIDITVSLSKSFPQMGSAVLPGGLTIHVGYPSQKQTEPSQSDRILKRYFSILWGLNYTYIPSLNEIRKENAAYLRHLIDAQINSEYLYVLPTTHPSPFVLLATTPGLLPLSESSVATCVNIVTEIPFRQSIDFNATTICSIKGQDIVRISIGLESRITLKDYANSIRDLSFALSLLAQYNLKHIAPISLKGVLIWAIESGLPASPRSQIFKKTAAQLLDDKQADLELYQTNGQLMAKLKYLHTTYVSAMSFPAWVLLRTLIHDSINFCGPFPITIKHNSLHFPQVSADTIKQCRSKPLMTGGELLVAEFPRKRQAYIIEGQQLQSEKVFVQAPHTGGAWIDFNTLEKGLSDRYTKQLSLNHLSYHHTEQTLSLSEPTEAHQPSCFREVSVENLPSSLANLPGAIWQTTANAAHNNNFLCIESEDQFPKLGK